MDELSALAVPSWVRGVWQRTGIRTDGRERNDALVYWIQTPTLYADIRVPSTAEDTPTPLPEGFAGWLDVEDQICRWRRPIDLNPKPGVLDHGAMFRDDEKLVEVGLLANYLENYQRIDPATRCFAASCGEFRVADGEVQFATQGPLDILVTAGTHVIHARRTRASALRYGRYDERTGLVSFDLNVGDPEVFAGDDGTWTIWTDDVTRVEREAFLRAGESKDA